MARASLICCIVLLSAGCRLPEREAVVRPLPEGQSFTYHELIARMRAQATAGVEAFYVDAWSELQDVAAALEQTSRFLPKTTQIPDALKDRLTVETDQLRQDASKLGEAARAKNARAVNESLQRINLRIRELRPDDKTPAPVPPPCTTQEQTDTPKKERYEYRQNADPDGTGKYYLGREIAPVMSHLGAGWLERPEREKEEHTSKLLPPLKIKAGDAVVDMGAGSGYYTVRLADLVGEKGKVYAVDIQPEMLELLAKRLKANKIKNVELIQGTASDPKLPDAGVDLILMVDVYHEFTHPYEMTEAMVKSLKPGGRLAFVEYRLEDQNVPIRTLHRMAQRQVLKEMEAFPLRHVETQKHLPWQHVIIFEKKESKKQD
jgi:FkbM family methyltransferase